MKKAEKIASSNIRGVLALNKEIPFTSVDVISYNLPPLAARLSQFEEMGLQERPLGVAEAKLFVFVSREFGH